MQHISFVNMWLCNILKKFSSLVRSTLKEAPLPTDTNFMLQVVLTMKTFQSLVYVETTWGLIYTHNSHRRLSEFILVIIRKLLSLCLPLPGNHKEQFCIKAYSIIVKKRKKKTPKQTIYKRLEVTTNVNLSFTEILRVKFSYENARKEYCADNKNLRWGI